MPLREWLVGQVAGRADGATLRRLAYLGSRYGPGAWLRYSPPVFGLAIAAALPKRRATVRDNLRRVLGERRPLVEQIDLARTFSNYAHCLAETLAVERPEAATPDYRISGEAHLRSLAARPLGFVVVTAHTGAWDAAARLLATRIGRGVMIVMEPEPADGARQLHDRLRARHGVQVAHVHHPLDALQLLRHLRAGGIVAMQLDRVARQGRSVDVSLCGRPFRVPLGPFQLAAATGTAVLPVFSRRSGHFAYEISISPAIELSRSSGAGALQEAARAACGEMERFIHAHPTHWFHFDPQPKL